MLRKLHNIVYLLILSLSIIGCSYTKDLIILSRKEAVFDIDYVVEKVKAIHPDPFTHISEEEFDIQTQKIKANLDEKIKREDFSLSIAELLALIRDDHTRHRDFPDFDAFCRSGGKLFPLKLRYKNNSMVVDAWAKTIKPKYLKKGDVLIAINEKPMKSLLKQYHKYISARTQFQQNWKLERRLFHFLWLTEGEIASFELTLINAEGKKYKETLPSVVAKSSLVQAKVEAEEPFPFKFYFDGQVCLLKAPSFWYALEENFLETLDNVFPQMEKKGASVLIVDLRKNGGGDGGLGWELIRRTSQKSFKSGSKKWRYSKAYQKSWLIAGLKQRGIPAFLHLENTLNLNNFHPNPTDLSKLKGEYIIHDHSIAYPYKDNWNGILVLITSRYTGSAAVDLAAIVKDNKLGIIAGEETGGRASYFSEITPVYLPNSGLLTGIASARWIRPAGYDDDQGVLPDLPLDVTLENNVLVEKIYNHIKGN